MVKVFLVGLLALALSAPLAAYPTPTDYRGQLKRWPITLATPDVGFRIVLPEGLNGAEHIAFTERAAELWSDVEDSYLRLYRLYDGDDSKAHITITLTDQFSGHSRSGGFAIFDKWNDSGPLHCRIEIPIVYPMRSGFPRTVLHELGHCIGLGHSLVPESVMSYNLKSSGFRLATDDRAGAARLYPADGSEPTLPLSCGVVHYSASPHTRGQGSTNGGRLGISVGTGVLAALHLMILLFGLKEFAPRKNPRRARCPSGER